MNIKNAPNLPSYEQPTTYQQAVAEISRNSALLVLKVHKQATGKAWGTKLKEKFHLIYLEVSSLPYMATSTDLTTYSDNRIGLD